MSGPGHPGKRPTPCRFYSSGNCVYGENCRNLHQQPSQSALQNPYQNGPLPMDNPGMLLHFEKNACLVDCSVYIGLKCIERLNLCELLLHRMCGNTTEILEVGRLSPTHSFTDSVLVSPQTSRILRRCLVLRPTV